MGGADGYPWIGGMGRAPAMLALFSFRSFRSVRNWHNFASP
jgi:hypothetical protein